MGEVIPIRESSIKFEWLPVTFTESAIDSDDPITEALSALHDQEITMTQDELDEHRCDICGVAYGHAHDCPMVAAKEQIEAQKTFNRLKTSEEFRPPYARLHRDKRTDDGNLKSARNRVMAEMCERAFAVASTDEAARDLEEPPAVALARLQRELATATAHRDFLMGQADSLIQRLAGAHVAAGLIGIAAAQGFVQKEIMPINNALAQIGAPEITP